MQWTGLAPWGAAMLLVVTGSLVSCKRSEQQETPAQGFTKTPVNTLTITFTYGSEKQKWVEAVTKDFNASGRQTSNGKPIVVQGHPMGSGDCIQEILQGKRQTHLVSPASAAFIKLGNAESQVKTGRGLVGETSNLVLSPVVIAMWKPMAEALDMVLRGPASYDCMLVYESVAIDYLKNAEGRWGALHLVYPQHNVWNDNPYYIINADWCGEAERKAADVFLNFLLSEPVQKQALVHGFRPAEPNVSLKGADSPFTLYSSQGLRIEIPSVCEPPKGDAITNLLTGWQRARNP